MQVDSLKKTDQHKWWKSIKNICGLGGSSKSVFDHLTYCGQSVNALDLSDVINNFLVSVGDSIPSLDSLSLNTLRSQLPECPLAFVVSEYSVYNALIHLKSSGSTGPDLLDNRLLIHLADVLSAPVCSLINSSIRSGIVPLQWRISRVSPIPKVTPALCIESDIRPISITPALSKIAESFIARFFNDHFCTLIDKKQFGSTKKRSTTHALIRFSHDLFLASDEPGNIIRILFVDFAKAFDLIDHNILMRKFIDNDFPVHLSCWSLSFLEERKQFVKVGNGVSSTAKICCGCPQGTLSGPNNFKLMINDLRFSLSYIKYVDDTSVASFSKNPDDTSLQSSLNDLSAWCALNSMKINTAKTKEMVIYFGKKYNLSYIKSLECNDNVINRVDTFKLLGVFFNRDLTWSQHVDFMLKKAAKRIYFIYLLVKSGLKISDVVSVYCSVIRSVLEYASPVWHPGLTIAQSKLIEGVQKRCLKIIFPELDYNDALFISGLQRLSVRRDVATRDLFNDVKHPDHVLHDLLIANTVPDRIGLTKEKLRVNYPYALPRANTNRLMRSFFAYCFIRRF